MYGTCTIMYLYMYIDPLLLSTPMTLYTTLCYFLGSMLRCFLLDPHPHLPQHLPTNSEHHKNTHAHTHAPDRSTGSLPTPLSTFPHVLAPPCSFPQDMASSVSALEIFADRQPVDFGLTAPRTDVSPRGVGSYRGASGRCWKVAVPGTRRR